MASKYYIQKTIKILKSKTGVSILILILFSLFLTGILSAKYYLFQNILNDDNTSRKDIYATKNLTVIDTYKTEQQKKAAGQSIDPVLVLADYSYISSDLELLTSNIKTILTKNKNKTEKQNELSNLFTMVSPVSKKVAINYLVEEDFLKIKSIFTKTSEELEIILNEISTSNKKTDAKTVTSVINSYLTAKSKLKNNEYNLTVALLEQAIIPNIEIDDEATEIAKKNAMDSIPPYIKKFQKGDKILYKGQKVNRFERAVLHESGYSVLDINLESFTGLFAVVLFSLSIFIYYLYSTEKKYCSGNYLVILGLLTILTTFVAVLKPDELSIYIVPIQLFTILIAVLINPKISFIGTLILLSLLAISSIIPLNVFTVFVIISLFIVNAIAQNKQANRANLLKIGIQTAILISVLILFVFMTDRSLTETGFNVLINDMGISAGISILSGIITLGILPWFESIFNVITPFNLAEFGDPNQPLLKKLQSDAPGTYAHSIAVANLAESAAEAINANPILARVGALYHDIGKLKRPLFFIENQPFFSIENPHNKINPKLSKMIVTAHTKDGVEIAKDKGLPQFIQDMIIQHHGQSLVSYFYYEALKNEGEENVQIDQFRYSGQKPTTKEAAIIMITDAVEAAARTLPDSHTQEELQNLIDKIIKEKVDDGQLSESPLTLKDLKIIAQTIEKVLRGTHHQRIKYHENIIQELENKNIERNETKN